MSILGILFGARQAHKVARKVAPKITKATEDTVRRVATEAVGAALGDKIARQSTFELETNAIMVNQTNSEPWYKSRVTLGAVGAILGAIGGIATAIANGATDPAVYISQISVIAMSVVTLYGRWVAKKAIGE